MSDKFCDIKVGDSIFTKHRVGLGNLGYHLSTEKYVKTFFIERKVTKVLKTQFSCGELRFTKRYGSGFGDNKFCAFKPNEQVARYRDIYVPSIGECQDKEARNYRDKIKPLMSYSLNPRKDEISPIHAIDIDSALEIHKEIVKLWNLIEKSK